MKFLYHDNGKYIGALFQNSRNNFIFKKRKIGKVIFNDMVSTKNKSFFKKGGPFEKIFKNGNTISIYKDGAKYIGQIFNNLFHGKGTFIFKDGSSYTGNYRNGKRDGKGIFTYKNGRKSKQLWKNGKQVK
jgi:hypothetical protein